MRAWKNSRPIGVVLWIAGAAAVVIVGFHPIRIGSYVFVRLENMYKSFYNLQRNPFEITPDPTFLFPTTRHNEALASLYYGVTSHRGFVVLTGEVGTGKTLILRSLLGLLQRRDVAFALIFNPTLSPLEFMRYIAGDFGLPVAGKAERRTDPCAEWFSPAETSEGIDDDSGGGRGAPPVAGNTGGDPAFDQPGNIATESCCRSCWPVSRSWIRNSILIELRQLKQRIALRCHLDPARRERNERIHATAAADCGSERRRQIFSRPAIEAVFQPLARYSAADQHHLRERAACGICETRRPRLPRKSSKVWRRICDLAWWSRIRRTAPQPS